MVPPQLEPLNLTQAARDQVLGRNISGEFLPVWVAQSFFGFVLVSSRVFAQSLLYVGPSDVEGLCFHLNTHVVSRLTAIKPVSGTV